MSRRILTVAASAVTVLASTLVLASLPASAAPDPATPYNYEAHAGGTLIRVVGSTVSSDPTAAASIEGSTASTTFPVQHSNSTASVHVGTVANAGVITTTAGATKVGTNLTSTATAETAAVNLLGGLITVDAAKTVTNAHRIGTDLSGDSDTKFVGVTINHKKINLLNVPNNFGINIPGVASVILNESKTVIDGGKVTETGSAVKVTLLKKYEGDPVGSTIAVNPTSATLTPSPAPSTLVSGIAFGAYVEVTAGSSTSIISGPIGGISTPPGGTFGYDIFNRIVGADIPLVIKSGVIQSRANALTSPNSADVTHEAKIADINVLNGLIKANAITATSRSQKLPTGQHIQTPSSELVGLVIGGKKISLLNTSPGTVITLPGVIRVVINEQTTNALGNQVAALHVTLLSPRSGLKTGAEIYVAVAGSAVF